jgi:acyl-coenzyme A thioesterase 13
MEKENLQLDLLKSKVGLTMKEGLSPYGHWIDGKLLEANYGKVKFEIEVRHDMTNPLQMLHGGASAGIVDEVIGIAVFSLGRNNFFSTINLVIDYFASAKLGDIIIAESKVVKSGNNIINVSCKLWDKTQQKLLAKASSNLMKIEQTLTF